MTGPPPWNGASPMHVAAAAAVNAPSSTRLGTRTHLASVSLGAGSSSLTLWYPSRWHFPCAATKWNESVWSLGALLSVSSKSLTGCIVTLLHVWPAARPPRTSVPLSLWHLSLPLSLFFRRPLTRCAHSPNSSFGHHIFGRNRASFIFSKSFLKWLSVTSLSDFSVRIVILPLVLLVYPSRPVVHYVPECPS